MNKFTKMLSSTRNELLKRRAVQIATSAQIAQENLVNAIKQDIVKTELRVQSLMDMGPDTADSLRPAHKDFDPQSWVAEIQRAKESLYEKKISLKIATATYNDLFAPIAGEDDEDDVDALLGGDAEIAE